MSLTLSSYPRESEPHTNYSTSPWQYKSLAIWLSKMNIFHQNDCIQGLFSTKYPSQIWKLLSQFLLQYFLGGTARQVSEIHNFLAKMKLSGLVSFATGFILTCLCLLTEWVSLRNNIAKVHHYLNLGSTERGE